MPSQNSLVIHPLSRTEWRAWLKKNHKTESAVWVTYWKAHTKKPTMSHRDSMEDAICFGWIDTIVKRLDDNRYLRGFAKRTKNANWSINTLSYAKRLKEEGKLNKAGLEAYELGLKKLPHDHGIPKNPDIPKDLKAEFKKNKAAEKGFMSLPPSARKTYLRWIEKAIQEDTRKKRIQKTIEQSLRRKKWGE